MQLGAWEEGRRFKLFRQILLGHSQDPTGPLREVV